jgi:hypothetical protein
MFECCDAKGHCPLQYIDILFALVNNWRQIQVPTRNANLIYLSQ